MEEATRKSLRLQGYDYSQAGAYFITICTDKKACLLGSVVGANCVRPYVALSNIGQCVALEIQHMSHIYPFLSVEHAVVMPNHVHLLLQIATDEDGRTQFAPTVSRCVKQFKGAVTKQIGKPIWQKSFHDHIVRNEQEYQKIWQYIDTNPLRWMEDCYYEPH